MEKYFKNFKQSLVARQGKSVSLLLSIQKRDPTNQAAVDVLSTRPERALQSTCQLNIGDENWGNVVCEHILACNFSAKKKILQAYEAQQKCATAFLRIFKEQSNWCLPILEVIFVDLRLLAAQVDKLMAKEITTQQSTKLGDTGRMMRQCLAEDIRDSDNPQHLSRQFGALFVANQCMKIFFALNTIKHCKALTLPSFPPLEAFNIRDRVTYSYFRGRTLLLEDKISEAEEMLSFAFRHCPATADRQRRSILIHLVPVRLILHQNKPSPTRRAAVPQRDLLIRYKLGEYVGLCAAFTTGNVQEFTQCLEEFEHIFLRNGVYLALERCKLFIYRTLFKKAYHAFGSAERNPLNIFLAATKVVGLDHDADEVECIFANLISKGLIRGYIAHQQQIAVLRKDDPFRVRS